MRKKYEGQALAMVLIVLVVAVVIGVSMLSRTLRDSKRVTDEKSSAEALEFADSILDVVKGTSVSSLVEVCDREDYGEGIDSDDGCSVTGVNSVKEFMTLAGLDSDSLDVFDSCSSASSELSLNLSLTDKDDEYEIRDGDVRSFVIKGQSPDPVTCTLDLEFEPRDSEFAGVVISKVYAKDYTEEIPGDYKEYSYDDNLQYCIYGEDSDCSESESMDENWIPVLSGQNLSIPLSSVSGYSLDEIRVKSLGGVVAIRSSLSDAGCVSNTEMLKVVAASNCVGTYRAKEVIVPLEEWGAPIFDYVMYNGAGGLMPEIIDEGSEE